MPEGELRNNALELVAESFLGTHAHKSVFDVAQLMPDGEGKDAILERAIASCVTDGTLADLLQAAKLCRRALTENELEMFATSRAASIYPQEALAAAAQMSDDAAKGKVLELVIATSVKTGRYSVATEAAKMCKRKLTNLELSLLVDSCLGSGKWDDALAAVREMSDGEAKWSALASVASARVFAPNPSPFASLNEALGIVRDIPEGRPKDAAYRSLALASLAKVQRRRFPRGASAPGVSVIDEALKLVAAMYFKHGSAETALIFIDLLTVELKPGEFEQLVSRV
jgi:hypothetical protein